VKVKDRRILADYLAFRRMSYAQLAQKVGCSKATIGHLMTGKTSGTKPEWARAIEEALDAPSGSLFVARVSRVSEDAA
jgi:transcriptional regulator with XRE-family HTH domain